MLHRLASGDLYVCRKLVGGQEAPTMVPDELSRTEWLTPWAAELRYDEPIALDRAAALVAAESASGWAASLLADANRPQPIPAQDLGS